MLQKFDLNLEPLKRYVTIHIHLPADYRESNDRYPVMYMFDGHNLFLDEDSTFGTSWKLEEFLNNWDKPMIMVGIECDHRPGMRLQEYTPYQLKETFFGPTDGRGTLLMDWVVNTLKPHIDKSYRTWPHRQATGVGGSSMGGLMAMYALLNYNQYFSKAACLSPTLSIARDQIFHDTLVRNLSPDTRVYWSFGELELSLDNMLMVQKQLHELQEIINEKGGSARMVKVAEGAHNEWSWSVQNADYMNYLWTEEES